MPKTTKAAAVITTVTDTEVVERAERYYKNAPDKPITTKIGIGVAKSYENPAIAAARAKRGGIYLQQIDPVTGEKIGELRHFSSMRYAYEGIGADLSSHIAFRGRVKQSAKPLKRTFEGIGTFLFSNAPVKLEAEKEQANA